MWLCLNSAPFTVHTKKEPSLTQRHVVEVAPIYDNPGEVTLLAAAEVVHSLIQLMADTPVKPTVG
jgi:arginase family enzyme